VNRIVFILIVVCGNLIAPSAMAQDIQDNNTALLESDLNLKKEILRDKMLKWHKIVGFITLGEMIVQGIVGFQLFEGKPVLGLHQWLAISVYTSYAATASLVLLAPKPKEKQRVGRVGLHRKLAFVHLTGMVLTFVAGELAGEYPEWKSVHRGIAIGTVAVFTTAAFIVTF